MSHDSRPKKYKQYLGFSSAKRANIKSYVANTECAKLLRASVSGLL